MTESGEGVNKSHQEKWQQESQSSLKQLHSLGFDYRFVPCCGSHVDHQQLVCKAESPPCLECRMRLFSVQTDTLINAENQKSFVPNGPVFETVSRLCQTIFQARLIQRYRLDVVDIAGRTKDGLPPIRAWVSTDFEKRPATLLIVTGKGESRAGILSIQQMVLAGDTVGFTEYYVQRALHEQHWGVVILDPNARGAYRGMECVEQSLSHLFRTGWKQPLHILAHSAAGGYLVRYLLLGDCRETLMDTIASIVFTDSTHNVVWCKDDLPLWHLLQSDSCLYVRNTATKPSDTFARSQDRKLGDTIPYDIWWQRRFGTIRTIWAGTTEHSLIFWTARNIVWDFFATAEVKRKKKMNQELLPVCRVYRFR